VRVNTIYFDANYPDQTRRKHLFNGQLLAFSPRQSVQALCRFADELIRDAFGPLEPRMAQHTLPVDEYVKILAQLKPKFINHTIAKQLVRAILEEMGCDLEKTYFDLPRLRTATSDNYLKSGIAYAFHPHRDTWYAAPLCQVNWWLPVYEIESDNAMAFHPKYWKTPVANGSRDLNYYEYVATARKDAAKYVKADTRKQPHPLEPIEVEPQLRVITPVGGMLLFSAAQLHSTVPNTSGYTRFSVDFRTLNVDDLIAGTGAPNIDTACTGTMLRDYLRASDFAQLPEELALPYDVCLDSK
jgi:hypothetical protein